MEKLFIYLTNLSSNGAYAIIFGILVACGLGFPLPEDIPLVASGYLCWDGTLEIIPTFLVTMIGVLIGDTILFFFGRKLGLRILERKQTFIKTSKIRRTRAYFRKYGQKIVFFARFVAGFRAAAFFIAGAMKMDYRRFILLDGLAALLSVPIWIAAGYGLGHMWGDQITQILRSLKHLKAGFTIVVFSLVTIVVVRAVVKYLRAKKLKNSLPSRNVTLSSQ
ncbi:MAG: DedA family protein [Deltaproteobacteria bacterium]|nr:DedA family protein [Deltaproteobacteria bacterium]